MAGFVKKHEIKLKPLLYGGTGIDSSNPNMPDSGFERYEAGSRNMLAIAHEKPAIMIMLFQLASDHTHHIIN